MSDDKNRVVAHLPDGMLEALDATIDEVKRTHNITLTRADVIRLGLVCFIRSVQQVTAGKQILTVGDIEQALTAHVKKRASDS